MIRKDIFKYGINLGYDIVVFDTLIGVYNRLMGIELLKVKKKEADKKCMNIKEY